MNGDHAPRRTQPETRWSAQGRTLGGTLKSRSETAAASSTVWAYSRSGVIGTRDPGPERSCPPPTLSRRGSRAPSQDRRACSTTADTTGNPVVRAGTNTWRDAQIAVRDHSPSPPPPSLLLGRGLGACAFRNAGWLDEEEDDEPTRIPECASSKTPTEQQGRRRRRRRVASDPARSGCCGLGPRFARPSKCSSLRGPPGLRLCPPWCCKRLLPRRANPHS
jgi:hypothetical protein